MSARDFVKKALKNLCVFTLVYTIWFILCFELVLILYKIFGENENIQLTITIIVSIILGFAIGIPFAKRAKNLRPEKKQNMMENQITTITGIIMLMVIILTICIIYKSKIGIIMSLGFIGALLLWDLGAFLAYKKLEKDIELVNQKLKEK